MQPRYLTLSFSHKSTPIALREQLAIPQDDLRDFILHLKDKIPSLQEILLLSTCNRVEFYLCTHAPQECIAAVLSRFSAHIGLELALLESHCQSALDSEAVHHIFSVVSGLDSIVLGETQIVGQMKEAYKLCFELGACAQEMTRLMHFAFRTAAKVRTQTAIAKASVSIASVCVKKALESSPTLRAPATSSRRALVLGAGEMGQLVARHLLDSGVNVYMSNRTKAKALAFATTLLEEKKIAHIAHVAPSDLRVPESKNPESSSSHASADSSSKVAKLGIIEWQDMPACLKSFDLLFSATSAQGFVITQDMARELDSGRESTSTDSAESKAESTRQWFDLAVPRDIDARCASESIQVICVDDLQQIIDKNRSQKKAQVQEAYGLIGMAVREYFHWIESLDVLPLIKSMRQKAKDASLQEVARAIKKGYLPKEQEEEVLRILHNAFNVFLHNPTLNLKDLSHHEEGDMIIQALQKVFTDNSQPKLLNRYKCEYETML